MGKMGMRWVGRGRGGREHDGSMFFGVASLLREDEILRATHDSVIAACVCPLQLRIVTMALWVYFFCALWKGDAKTLLRIDGSEERTMSIVL